MVCFKEPNVDFYTNNFALARQIKYHFGNRIGKGRFRINVGNMRYFYVVHDLVQLELIGLLEAIEDDHSPDAVYSVRISSRLEVDAKSFVRLRANVSGKIRTIKDKKEIRSLIARANLVSQLEQEAYGE